MKALVIVVGAAQAKGPPTVHCWLEYNGRIIDPTRQQFGRGPVTYWRAKKQDLTPFGFWRQVGQYLERHPDAPEREVLEALCERVYEDNGLWQKNHDE